MKNKISKNKMNVTKSWIAWPRICRHTIECKEGGFSAWQSTLSVNIALGYKAVASVAIDETTIARDEPAIATAENGENTLKEI